MSQIYSVEAGLLSLLSLTCRCFPGWPWKQNLSFQCLGLLTFLWAWWRASVFPSPCPSAGAAGPSVYLPSVLCGRLDPPLGTLQGKSPSIFRAWASTKSCKRGGDRIPRAPSSPLFWFWPPSHLLPNPPFSSRVRACEFYSHNRSRVIKLSLLFHSSLFSPPVIHAPLQFWPYWITSCYIILLYSLIPILYMLYFLPECLPHTFPCSLISLTHYRHFL